jgi:penicillin-binding protein 2
MNCDFAGDAVNFSIGQGDTVITPVKLAQMYAAIANGGTIWKPTIAKAIVKTDGTVVKAIEKEKLGSLPADKKQFASCNQRFAKL